MRDLIDHPNLVAALANAQSIVLECDHSTQSLSLPLLEYSTVGTPLNSFEMPDYIRGDKDLFTLRIGRSSS